MLFLLPLFSALIYPFGGLWIKQSQELGAGPWRIAVLGNLIIAACFMALLLLRPAAPDWNYVGWPLLAGCCFFGGQFFTVLALRIGDVSLVAPVMGCKILFVALYSSLLGVESLAPLVLAAAGCAALAIFLLGWKDRDPTDATVNPARKKSAWLTICLSLTSCAFFAGVDTVFAHAGKSFGSLAILITGMGFFALLSLIFTPFAIREPAAPKSRKANILGNIVFGVQAVVLNFANVMLAQPTIVNIIYSSRGLFGITHTWFIGHYFENTERQETSKPTLVRRCIGAALLMLSIALVVLS